ncbi:hypothetical protein D8I24_0016 (plasmid) [Cupriavidus necator H850]|nr:hypothetical protein D8I24_0016 [Cupriavidus necator H850]
MMRLHSLAAAIKHGRHMVCYNESKPALANGGGAIFLLWVA